MLGRERPLQTRRRADEMRFVDVIGRGLREVKKDRCVGSRRSANTSGGRRRVAATINSRENEARSR